MTELFSQREFPLFQNKVFQNLEDALDSGTGDISLIMDESTGLVSNQLFNPALMQYDETYQNEQALSSSFLNHLDEVAEIISNYIGKKKLVEIGCGKGTFLEILQNKHAEITGFDPSYEGNNPLIKKDLFNHELVGSAEGLILRHVLEHVKNPLSFLEEIKKENNGLGKIYIEVPSMDWILNNKAWFDIFYEHVNYFFLDDFHRMFKKIYSSGTLFGGQYIYVIADISSLHRPVIDSDYKINFPVDFQDGLNTLTPASNSIIWGASSKGVIYSLLLQRRGHSINYAVDINPAKQGKYLPLSGVKVLSPQDFQNMFPEGTTIYVMNSQYMNEIKNLTSNKYKYIGVID